MGKLALHWQILIAMVLGVIAGLLAAQLGLADSSFGQVFLDLIRLAGDLFTRLLRMIAVPLVLFSLVSGVASLSDTKRLARMGGKTIGLYLGTTAVAITIGLIVVNIVRPGSGLSPSTRDSLREAMVTGEALTSANARVDSASQVSVMRQVLDMVPSNPFAALSEGAMLQVVVFSMLLGVALTRMPNEKSGPVVVLFSRLSDAIIELVQMIMRVAPFGVFALIATVVTSVGNDSEALGELGLALLSYAGTVILGLALHAIFVYLPLLHFVGKVSVFRVMRAIMPAQLLAFSSSSSAATLPVTIDCVEKGVGVDKEATSFVLPLGATINMDGTGLYQGVAAVFIATMYNLEIGLAGQVQIVLMAALASIGTAAVPGVGIVMLVMVLQQIDVPPEGIALILAVDRPLDMCRTVLNVTGDATVCTTVAASEGLLHEPDTKVA